MAEVDAAKVPTLSEHYHLKGNKEQQDLAAKPAEEPEVKNSPDATSEEVSAPPVEETPTADETEAPPSAVAEETNESVSEETPAAAEESKETAEEESSEEQEVEETPEIKLETAPADFRFPTTNQSRHCFTRYVEYHRCVAAKGEGAPECDKFAKYYRSLCPGEWVDRWNEQRENGTFPGPL